MATMRNAIAVWVGVMLAVTVVSEAAEPTPAGRTAEVSGVFGLATASSAAGDAPLREGDVLAEGAVIRTAPGAAVDIYLGPEAGVVRLTQNTVLSLDQLQGTNSSTSTYLHLQHGTVLGNGSKVRAGSRYQIKTSVGIAAIGSAAFRLHAEGYLVVVEGKAQFAYVPVEGEAKVHVLSAPPAVYFSAFEGVKEAPKPLVREVIAQSKARLGTRDSR